LSIIPSLVVDPHQTDMNFAERTGTSMVREESMHGPEFFPEAPMAGTDRTIPRFRRVARTKSRPRAWVPAAGFLVLSA
jgi:hypothetical protein